MTRMRVAVVGAGVVGLSVAHSLGARDGVEVLCLEAAAPMSQRSAGTSRIFRLAHADPGMVDLARRSRELFAQWESAHGRPMIGDEGFLLAAPDAGGWAAAMAAAGVARRVVDGSGGTGWPFAPLPGPVLVDSGGGVIDVLAVGGFLRSAVEVRAGTVRAVEPAGSGAVVVVGTERHRVDAVVLAAGAGTGRLAAQAGIDLDPPLHRHLRLTYRLTRPDEAARPAPCLVDRSESWRPGFTSYQHRSAAGRWAVGAHLPLDELPEDPAELEEQSRRITAEYVRARLPGVEPTPVEEISCDVAAGWGDGVAIRRRGTVLALAGDNLFKIAPILGRELAAAVLDGSVPASHGAAETGPAATR